MKIGIISDIHRNIYALRACVEYLEKEACEEYLLLGDFVSDTPYTRETMDYLYDFIKTHTCKVLRGNREEYMISQRTALREGKEQEKWIYNSASGNLKFAYEQLTEQDLDFFECLPISFRYEKEGYPSITCAHGSPSNSRELLKEEAEQTRKWMEEIDTEYLICAHTHLRTQLEYKGKVYFNPGSAGIAIGTPGIAQCMMIQSVHEEGNVRWKASFLSVPYDNQRVVQDMVSSGLLEKAPWFINSNIHIFLTGEDLSATLVKLAGELAKEEDEDAIWPQIDETYFMKAAAWCGIPDYRKCLL